MPISSSLAVLEFFPRLRYLTLVKQRYIRLRTEVLRDDNDGGGKKEELFINEKNYHSLSRGQEEQEQRKPF